MQCWIIVNFETTQIAQIYLNCNYSGYHSLQFTLVSRILTKSRTLRHNLRSRSCFSFVSPFDQATESNNGGFQDMHITFFPSTIFALLSFSAETLL